jgi:hypothetical protein
MRSSLERYARLLCEGHAHMHESLAVRDCQHYMSVRVHPSLRVCCGCGHVTPNSELGMILGEAFK